MAKKKGMRRSEIVLRKKLDIGLDKKIDIEVVRKMAEHGNAVAKAYLRGD
jgi:hypothetical protein